MAQSTTYCQTCLAGKLHEFAHGRTGYKYHRCRCDTCRNAMRERRHRQRVNALSRARYADPVVARKSREKCRVWHASNTDTRREYHRAYREANRSRVSESARTYRERNRDYLKSLYRDRYSALRSIPAPRKGKAWSQEEDQLVARKDVTVKELAYILGRSYKSVIERRRCLRKATSIGLNEEISA